MNLKLLLILIVGIGALSSGFLANEIALEIQKVDVIIIPPGDGSLTDATQFSSVECACGTNSNGPFGVCDQSESPPGVPSSTSLGPNGNKLCPP